MRGEVTGAAANKPIAVILVRDHRGKRTIFNYSMRYGPGAFRFVMTPGSAYLFAFEDANGDLKYQKGEPAAWYGGTSPKKITLKDGETTAGLTIRLSRNLRLETDTVAPVERPSEGDVKLGRFTYSNGEVTSLDDGRFTEEKGKQGLFEPIHFAILNGMGSLSA